MSTLNPVRPLSKAVAFLIAAHNGMPKTLGDRDRVKAMSSVIGIAIDTRMPFDVTDGEAIEKARMGIETCVGVFRPLDDIYYYRAVKAGGTYARMWERRNNVKPFVAPQAWTGEINALPRIDDRFCPGLAIILPDTTPGDGLERTAGGAVWWCTSIDFQRDRVVLCRYSGNGVFAQPYNGYQSDDRRPKARLSLTRSDWNEAVKTIVLSAKTEEAQTRGAA